MISDGWAKKCSAPQTTRGGAPNTNFKTIKIPCPGVRLRPQVQPKWTVQLETNNCFRGNVHFFSSRDDLGPGSCSRARDSADGRPFSAACNRADDSAEY